MYELNVYVTLRFDDTRWYFSWMAKNRNLGLGQKDLWCSFIFTYIRHLNTQN